MCIRDRLTPFERPSEFADKSTVTDEEAEEFAQHRVETSDKDRRDGGAAADVERAYNDFWWDFGHRIAKQPSLVIDPPDVRGSAAVAPILVAGFNPPLSELLDFRFGDVVLAGEFRGSLERGELRKIPGPLEIGPPIGRVGNGGCP